MAYVPYGYTITDGIVTVDERAADQVRVFFEKYISGLSLAVAGEQAGIGYQGGGSSDHNGIPRTARKPIA